MKPQLTDLEAEILSLICSGLDLRTIARRTHISAANATKIRGSLRVKLGAPTVRAIAARAGELGLGRRRAVKPKPPAVPHVTEREREILEQVALGHSNGKIARRMGITVGTVNGSMTVVRLRIGGKTRFDVVRRAREYGLIRIPEREGLQEVTLTLHERRVLELTARQLTQAQVGRRLGISRESVCVALSYARKKLRASTTQQAVAVAAERGLITVKPLTDVKNPITAAEYAVLDGLYAGHYLREVAAELGVDLYTVVARLEKMKANLGAGDTQELLDEAQRLQLYSPQHPRKRLVPASTLTAMRSPAQASRALTPRQHDVIRAFARRPDGSLPEVARDLGVSASTVKAHLRYILPRLGVRSSRDVAEAAYRLGLVRAYRRPR